jgi:septal ring factor EnvC (AmiA/AmiB activator)
MIKEGIAARKQDISQRQKEYDELERQIQLKRLAQELLNTKIRESYKAIEYLENKLK